MGAHEDGEGRARGIGRRHAEQLDPRHGIPGDPQELVPAPRLLGQGQDALGRVSHLEDAVPEPCGQRDGDGGQDGEAPRAGTVARGEQGGRDQEQGAGSQQPSFRAQGADGRDDREGARRRPQQVEEVDTVHTRNGL